MMIFPHSSTFPKTTDATQDIFNEIGRKKRKDDVSPFVNFPKDYQFYLIKRVKKSHAKKSWRKCIFRENLGKNRVLKDKEEWVKWQQELHKPSQSESRSDEFKNEDIARCIR